MILGVGDSSVGVRRSTAPVWTRGSAMPCGSSAGRRSVAVWYLASCHGVESLARELTLRVKLRPGVGKPFQDGLVVGGRLGVSIQHLQPARAPIERPGKDAPDVVAVTVAVGQVRDRLRA